MVFKNFKIQVILRVILIGALFTAFHFTVFDKELVLVGIFILLLIIYLCYSLIMYVETANRDLKRFLDSIRYSDFSQTFADNTKMGKSFRDLNKVFTKVMDDFKKERMEKEEQNQFLQTIVKHIRVGLITFFEDGKVSMVNDSALQLLGLNSLKSVKQLQQISPELALAMMNLRSGENELIKVDIHGDSKQLAMFSSKFVLRGLRYNLVSLQNIKGELERERMSKELEIAHNVQMALLPQDAPNVPGYDIWGICKPAKEVGGDYYDFVFPSENNIGIVIGDVSGKGTPAAIYMTLTKGFFKANAENKTSTKEVLTKLNKFLYETIDPGYFVTMTYTMLDYTTSEVHFTRGGHNELIHYKAAENKCVSLAPTGLGLGLADEAKFESLTEEDSFKLEKNDIIVLYTDGLVEAMNSKNETFTDERLVEEILENNSLAAKDFVDKIISDVKRFSSDQDQHDDMTLIVIKKL